MVIFARDRADRYDHGSLRVCATNVVIRSAFLKNLGASGEGEFGLRPLHALDRVAIEATFVQRA